MRIIDLLQREKPCFSFEFFPPKDEAGVESLFGALAELAPYRPAYVSVTYGAGGSTRSVTVDLVRRIRDEIGLEAMAHLTCVGSSRDELRSVLQALAAAGIENVLPLRGDPPKGEAHFSRPPGGFLYASELVSFIRSEGFPFCLAGACYPERHPEAASIEADIEALRKKVDAGADFLITQLFFDNQDFYRFLDRLEKAGITVPVVAGLMPITNVAQVKRFTQMCGASIPSELLSQLETSEADRAKVRAIGVEHATRQAEDLIRAGVPGLHFYTLNRSLATREILDNLGVPSRRG